MADAESKEASARNKLNLYIQTFALYHCRAVKIIIQEPEALNMRALMDGKRCQSCLMPFIL